MLKQPKPKKLTFVVQDMDLHTISLVQWQTGRRTLEAAWLDCRATIYACQGEDPKDADFLGRFEKIMALEGLVTSLDETVPLRRATPAEMGYPA